MPGAPHTTAPDPLAALADRCVQCGLCLPHCPTYGLDRQEAESPRGRIAYIKATASGLIASTATGDAHLDHCLGCRRCESVCPAQVPFGSLLTAARERQFQRRTPALPLRAMSALLARPSLLSRLLTLYRLTFDWLPGTWRRLPKPAPMASRSVKAADAANDVYLGCIARSYEGPALHALHQLAAQLGERLAIPAGQTCCGTAATHLGDRAVADALADRNRRAFSGRKRVLSLATGCQHGLAQSLAGHADVVDVFDWLDRQRDRLAFRPSTLRVALHLPCSQGSGAALRRLLAMIPGLAVLDLPASGCCGAAGLHMLAEPERAAALRAPLLAGLSALKADVLISANIGCRLHLANAVVLPVQHPLELLAAHLP